jgi:hypothetical protein
LSLIPSFWLLHGNGDEVKKIFTYYTLPRFLLGLLHVFWRLWNRYSSDITLIIRWQKYQEWQKMIILSLLSSL